MYVLAFVKEVDTKQVLNSGTRFDPELVSAAPEPATKSIRFSPNPATQSTFAEIGDDTALRTEVFAPNGKLVYVNNENQGKTVVVPTANFAPGVYFVKITGEKGIYAAKMVKE